jgi:hypothetical protein
MSSSLKEAKLKLYLYIWITMENLETYLYVFFAVIYIISRIIKARSKQNQQQKPVASTQQHMRPQAAQPSSKPKRGFSFDDILRDFEKNLAGENPSVDSQEESIPVVQEIRHEKPAPIAVKTIEEQPRQYQKYRDAKIKARSKIGARKAPVFVRNEKFAIKENIASEYVKMLKDPEGFRNAIVLSEIINRKYF